MHKKKVSIVIGSFNRNSFLRATIKSVRNEISDINSEIIVVDGGSTDGTLEWLVKQKDIITIIQHNRGVFNGKQIERRSWGYFMNLAFKATQGEYILMLSDDCLLIPGSLDKGLQLFDSMLSDGKKVGAAAFYWRNWPDQEMYNVGLTFGKKFVNHGLYLRSALEEISWINETDYHFYHADGDLCLRLWENGYEVIDSPDSYVEHFTHANVTVRKSNLERQQNDWNHYKKMWETITLPGEKIDADWIYKSYSDPVQITSLFPFQARLKVKIAGFIQKLRKKIITNKI